ncbi:hypothetical protein B0I37DRAFT_354512 [Chaetomium sp. MPI-CAGE-AT-0009]|nr:hypothetical protein B0I37DRAFT_354512 [Chaetomium sp. MPI-CAGE-AT-0009]
MVMSMQTTLLAAALLVLGVACQDTTQQPVLTYPPDGSKSTYRRMDTVIVNYTVFYDTAELYTFYRRPQNGNRLPLGDLSERASMPILLNFASDKPCWFDVRAGPNGTNNRSSASFNILSDERRTGPQTFGVDTDAPTDTESTPSATSSTHTSNETSSPPPEEGTGGLKGWALYAVAFCSGIGGAILFGLAFRLWWKWECWQDERKRKAALAALALQREERLRNARNGNNGDNGGNGGSGGRGIGGEAGAPRLDVDVFEWRRGGGNVKRPRGEARDELEMARVV